MQMKRSAVAVVAAATLVLTACAPAGDTTSEKMQITFMNGGVSPAFEASDFEALIAAFEEKNPDIEIVMLTPPSAERDAYTQTLLAAGNFPDVSFTLQVAQFREFLQPFDLDDPDIAQLSFIDSMLDGGELYQLGNDVQVWNTVFYNKDLFAEAGIDEAPTTRGEFVDAMEALKDAGITPLLTSGEWVPTTTFLSLFPIFAENECWYGQRAAGDVSFTDPEWLEAGETYKAWIDAGYVNEGALGLGYTQLGELFNSGAGAMYPMGSWYATNPLPDFPVGVIAMPTDEGSGPLMGSIGSTGYTVSNLSENIDAAVKFAKFMALDPLAVKAWGDTGSLMGVDLAEPIEFEQTPLQADIQKLVDDAPSFYTAYNGQGDCNLVPGTQDEINKAVQAIMTGTTPLEAFTRVDEFWDDAG